MTTTLAIVAIWLVVGVLVAFAAKYENWTSAIRWWHVVFWPLLPIGWVIVLIGFWMAGSTRR